MTDRQRFVAHMNYQPVDRCPMCDFGFLDATIAEWQRQGLPADADVDQLFGMDRQWDDLSPAIGLTPPFERKVLEDRGDREVIRDEDGVVAVKLKGVMGMPQWLEFPIKNGDDWRRFKRRLDPDTPGRIPPEWADRCRQQADRDYPLLLNAGSLYGWPRNWMGVETLSKLLYRDPTLFPEITETLAHLTMTVLGRAP